jgi:RNA polymerase sigma-70 factor (ECF subfamily)
LGVSKEWDSTRPELELGERHQSIEELSGDMATLPEEHHQVVALRHLVGLAPREIADRTRWTVGSIHGLHHRGRRALQRGMARLESTPCTRAVRHLTAV